MIHCTNSHFFLKPSGCDDPAKICNCDVNDGIWRQDDGYLTDKSTLPVTVVRIGDTGSVYEIAYYMLGPLVCSGTGIDI